MVARNDITGEPLVTRAATEQYRNNYDAIFGKKKAKEEVPETEVKAEQQENNDEK